jgi:osmoprotectant transport system ATP-binding protein
MIELRQAGKTFGGAAALHPTDLNFASGQTTALLGPSGCGKSTILRMIVGLIAPSQGAVLVNGEPVSPANVVAVRRRMGYVIQDGGLFPHLTAEGNALLLARHLKRSEVQSRQRLEELCRLTRFPADALTRYPAELSGGQRQRVSLMRALMLQPEALLLDEPLGALDPLVRASLQTDLRDIFRELKQTVVLVTHDLAEAAYLADHIVLMESGRVAQEGTLDDLKQRPATPFVTEFLNAQRSVVAL